MTGDATYILLCGGVGYRWHNYLGVNKHLVVLDYESILHRTVRQLNTYQIRPLIVAAFDDDRYRLPGSRLCVPDRLTPSGTGADKFYASAPWWDPDRPTVLMWGDTWWSDEAIHTLVSYDGADRWRIFYRPGPSQVNGRKHGELFAHRFTSDLHVAELAAADRVVDLHRRGLIPWLNVGGWSQYRAMLGLPDRQVHGWVEAGHPHATVIDDWTDDFDAPYNYRLWLGNRAVGRYPFTVRGAAAFDAADCGIPESPPGAPKAEIRVHRRRRLLPSQVWAAVAHAVEHDQRVVPYSKDHLDPFRPTPMGQHADIEVVPASGVWGGDIRLV